MFANCIVPIVAMEGKVTEGSTVAISTGRIILEPLITAKPSIVGVGTYRYHHAQTKSCPVKVWETALCLM